MHAKTALGNLRILVTNDDGIHAPGLKVLERIARTLSKDVWVVAPETEQSGVSHSLTLHTPLRVRKISARRFAVNGTPTDCVMLAAQAIIPHRHKARGQKAAPALSDAPCERQEARSGGIDLVLSGVNPSSNVADDVTYSGTVAAAMEGALLKIPSIAFSQAGPLGSEKIRWQCAERHAPGLIRRLLDIGWPENRLININFPDCPPQAVQGVRFCPQGKRKIGVALDARLDPKGRPYYWIGGEREETDEKPGVDVSSLHEGFITVTPLCLDLTDYKALGRLREQFEAPAPRRKTS